MPAAVEKMLYNRQNGLPWHKEGTSVEGLATAEQCLEHAGLDFTVETRPVFAGYTKDAQVGVDRIGDSMATVRTDTGAALGIVSGRYVPVQNREAFGFFDAIVGDGQAIYETAGSLDGGRKVWLLAKLPGQIQVVGDDVVNKYLLLTIGHDGKLEIVAGFTPVRVVCLNTLTLAVGDAVNGGAVKQNFIGIRHTGNPAAKLVDAGKLMKSALEFYSQAELEMQAMAKAPMGDKDAELFMRRVYRREVTQSAINARSWKGLNDLMRLRDDGTGIDLPGVRGTVWAAYNAVAEFEDYARNIRETTSRVGRIAFGDGARRKIEAFAEAKEFMADLDGWRMKGQRREAALAAN